MAKKRIAADIDLCGNSVENVKDITASGKVTGNLDGALLDAVTHQGRVVALPFYSYTTLDMQANAPSDEYIQALLKKIVSEHSDLLGKTLVGVTQRNYHENVILYTYPLSSGISNGLPRYCSGVVYTGATGMEYRFWINNGVFGSKTISDTNGDLLGARTDHSGNVISTTYATKSEVSNKVTKNDPTGAVAYEGNLKFGTGSVAGSVNPVDMALIQECGANRFAFLPPECITIEYSRDAGATWSDYGASDVQKVSFFSVKDAARFYIGKSSTSNPATADCRLRITLKTQTDIAKMYTALRKFFIWISTGSQASCWCTIRVRTMANIESGTDSWNIVADKVRISGDKGGNIINIPMIVTYNRQKSHHGEMQFIFGSDADATGGYAGLSIFNIFAFGDQQWTSQSEMAKTGHLYAYDYAQNATFPNGVKAKQFTGDLVGRANNALMDAENNNISATYLKKTDAESTYATKTTTNGLQSQISSMVSKTKNLSSDGSTFSGNAVNDGDGNKISETYAKKTELSDTSDGFYSAPKLIVASSDNTVGDRLLRIDHPCKGASGVEFVLMTKTKRMRTGYVEGKNRKTKDTKRGWTIAQNFRRGAMSYNESSPLPCVLEDELENYNAILQYVKKYYMYPAKTAAMDIQTSGMPITNLYFGGWNMTSKFREAKVFGIAARRLKSDGKYEYSQPAAILIVKSLAKGLRIGVL